MSIDVTAKRSINRSYEVLILFYIVYDYYIYCSNSPEKLAFIAACVFLLNSEYIEKDRNTSTVAMSPFPPKAQLYNRL